MIFELTKNLAYLGGDFVLRDENLISFCKIDFIKDGLILTNNNGNLIAQLLINKNSITAAIADGPSVVINRDYEITPAIFDKDADNIDDTAQSRIETAKFFYFGKPNLFQYDLYIQEQDSAKPYLAAEIINHPWKEQLFKVRISDKSNKVKTLAIVLSFALIATKK